MKLSERNELGGISKSDDFLHLVRNGNSYRATLQTVFNNAKLPIRWSINGREYLIFRKDPDGHTSLIMSAGDILLYVDTNINRMVIGLAIDTVSSFPTDLEDSSVFLKFFDANAFL